jgi:hypothetical protein
MAAATQEAKDTKAEKANASAAASAPVDKTLEDSEFFGGEAKEVGQVDIHGWYSPAVALVKKQRLVGQIVGHTSFPTKFGVRQTVIVKLDKPLTAASKTDGEDLVIGLDTIKVKDLKVGEHVAVGISSGLDSLLDYVENRGRVLIIPKSREKLADGRNIWKFAAVRVIGKMGRRPAVRRPEVDAAAGGAPDDDDIPF